MLGVRINFDGEPEINEFDSKCGGINENIFGFDIAMHEPTMMHIAECLTHLPGNVGDLMIIQVTIVSFPNFLIICNQVIGQIIEDQVCISCITEYLMKFYNIRMLQSFQCMDLTVEDD